MPNKDLQQRADVLETQLAFLEQKYLTSLIQDGHVMVSLQYDLDILEERLKNLPTIETVSQAALKVAQERAGHG